MADRLVRTRGVIRGRVERRATQWLASTIETAQSNLAASSVVLDQSFAFGEKATIVRVRGALWVGSDQEAAEEKIFGAIGMAVVTNQALAIGVTAVPLPIQDQGSDNWLLWLPFFADVRPTSAVGVEYNTFSRVEFESKSMRKVDDGDSVVVVLENSATFGMQYLLEFRMLVKLHT